MIACLLFGGLGFFFVNRLDQSLGDRPRARRAARAHPDDPHQPREGRRQRDQRVPRRRPRTGRRPRRLRRRDPHRGRDARRRVQRRRRRRGRPPRRSTTRSRRTPGSSSGPRQQSPGLSDRRRVPAPGVEVVQNDALPPLAKLVENEQRRVESASNAARDTLREIFRVAGSRHGAGCVVTQVWLYRRTHRVLNPPLLVATALVIVVGGSACGVVALVAERRVRGPATARTPRRSRSRRRASTASTPRAPRASR